MSQPFWEHAYLDKDAPSAFGPPSDEIQTVAAKLSPGARVLDLGCGDGRNAVFLLEQGLHVTALDVSEAAIGKLLARAGVHSDRLRAEVRDVRHCPLDGPYDLIVAHGLFHLMPREDWTSVLRAVQQHTAPAGYNVVAVFTDALPPPPDLRPFMRGLFREGELLRAYDGWRIELTESYVLQDEHPGGIRHRHPVNKLVAQKPA